MAQTRLKMDGRRPLKDGTCPIRVVVGHGSNIYLSTDVWARPEEWNERAQMIEPTAAGARGKNALLTSRLRHVMDAVSALMSEERWAEMSREERVEELEVSEAARARRARGGVLFREGKSDEGKSSAEKRRAEKSKDGKGRAGDDTRAKYAWESTAGSKRGAVTLADAFSGMLVDRKKGTKDAAQTAARRIEAYAGPIGSILLRKIDRAWVEGFLASLTDCAVNTRVMYMSHVHHAVNWSLDRDLIQRDPFKGLRLPRAEATRMRDLTREQLRAVAALELDARRARARWRDLFLLSFYLIGINLADLCALTPDSVKDGRVEYRRAKTGKLYSVRVEPEAAAIVERMGGWPPEMLRGRSMETLTRTGSRELRAIGEKIGVRGMSWYWARYTWATLAAEIDTPTDVISQALGHSHGSAVTAVYIRRDRAKVDAANRRLIDWVFGNWKRAL